MKKRKCKFIEEFKTFITRGNVIDLAVGMIIGAAFTAIVSALVNGIFKPLIDAIPIGDMSGLKTILVYKNAEGQTIARGAEGFDLSKSVYIDWGAFLMAIVNFLLTAFILFCIIKVINSVREGMDGIKLEASRDKAKIAELKAQGMTKKQIRDYFMQQDAEAAAKAAEEAAANAPEPTDKILKDIRALLMAQAGIEPETAEKAEPEASDAE